HFAGAVHSASAHLRSGRYRGAALMAAIAIRDNRAARILAELGPASCELRERDVQGVEDPSALVVLGFANVQHYGVLTIDELGRLHHADFPHRAKPLLNERPYQHPSRNKHYEDEWPIVLYELNRSRLFDTENK